MATQLLTIAWGWDGMTAAAGFLLVALVCVAGLWFLNDPPRRPTLHDLSSEWRAVVAVVLALLFAGAALDEVWGAIHVRGTQVTVSGLDEGYVGDHDIVYYVKDTQGRRFTVREALYRRLHKGDRVVCQRTVPLIRRSALLSCERQTARWFRATRHDVAAPPG
jgi:hypothetical protein